LPAYFVREFGNVLSDYVILRDPNHNEFEVRIVRRSGEMYFGDGWRNLEDAYELYFGGWVTVVYNSPALLTIRVCGRRCLEIVYPSCDPPLRHLLARSDPHCRIGSSVMSICPDGSARPESLIKSYVKDLTLYDVHSVVLVVTSIFCFIGFLLICLQF
jgi:MoaA/NifB/PqqE/SkfB family radical SAM enzyme